MTDAQTKPLTAEEIEDVRAVIKCGGYHDGMNVHRMLATIEALTPDLAATRDSEAYMKRKADENLARAEALQAKQEWDEHASAALYRTIVTVTGDQPMADEIRNRIMEQFTPPSQVWRTMESAPKDRRIDLLMRPGVRWCGAYWDHICSEWRVVTLCGQLLTCKTALGWMEEPPTASPQEEKEPSNG